MSMNENQKMANEIRLITAVDMLVTAFVSQLIFPGTFKSVALGIVVGAFVGIMGFNMIYRMAENIDGDTLDVKNRAMKSYTRRYLMYAVIFVLSASVGMNVIALLVGMLAHKASILIYTMKHRKEDD